MPLLRDIRFVWAALWIARSSRLFGGLPLSRIGVAQPTSRN